MSAAKLNNRKCVSAITGSMISHAVLCELYVHAANIYVRVCVCIYIYIYIHIHTHTHTKS
jgi:hypothetical protein